MFLVVASTSQIRRLRRLRKVADHQYMLASSRETDGGGPGNHPALSCTFIVPFSFISLRGSLVASSFISCSSESRFLSAKMLKLLKNVKKLHFRKFSTSSEKKMPRPNSVPVEATMKEHNINKWDWERPVISVADVVRVSCSFAFGCIFLPS